MLNATRTITIAAPLAKVFAFFTDPANETSWRTGVKDIHAHGEPAVGAVIHQTVKGPLGRGIPADIEITDYTWLASYGFKGVAGPVRPVGSYDFRQTEDDGTAVTFTLAADLGGGRKERFMGKAVQRSMEAEMAALDRAKALLEG
ncbi:SRPBCC family protein [Nocardioides ultimimeridianus]